MPDSLQIALKNDSDLTNVHAYVTGIAIQHGGQRCLLKADGRDLYFPQNPPSIGSPLKEDCAIPLGKPGSTVTITIPQMAGGRIWIAEGELTFLLNPGAAPALVEPSVLNPSDPNANVNFGFCEFTLNNDQLYANISYVDFVPRIPIAISLQRATGDTEHVTGMAPDGLDSLAQDLEAQARKDHQPWDKLVVKHDGRNIRVVNATHGNAVGANSDGYFEKHIEEVWRKYKSGAKMRINTQAAPGIVEGHVNKRDELEIAGEVFHKPNTADILGCNSGPFTTGPSATRNAIIPRLAAGFVRSSFLESEDQPSQPNTFYKVDPTNHYARLVHKHNLDGKGYAFAYDDVQTDDGDDQSGKVNAGDPKLFTVVVGGKNAASGAKHAPPVPQKRPVPQPNHPPEDNQANRPPAQGHKKHDDGLKGKQSFRVRNLLQRKNGTSSTTTFSKHREVCSRSTSRDYTKDPIVRINPDELHIADPDFYEVLYSGKRDKWPPAAGIAGGETYPHATVGHDMHRQRRAATNPLMSRRVAIDAIPLIQQQLANLQQRFGRAIEDRKAVELGTIFLAFTTDVAGQYFFRETLGMQDDDGKAAEWKHTTHSIARGTPVIKQFPGIMKPALRIPLPIWKALSPVTAVLLQLQHDLSAKAQDFLKAMEREPQAKMVDDNGRPLTIFHAVYQNPGPDAARLHERLTDEAFSMMVTGGETSAKVLTRAIYYLCNHEEANNRLRNELKEASRRLGKDVSSIPLTELERLPWLTAVIRESLRITALVTSRLPLQPHSALQYDKWIIPAMTPVSLSPYDVLMNPTIYPDPDCFVPSRWLHESAYSTEKIRTDLERYFVPFGKGARMCQGVNLAWAELCLALAVLVPQFDFTLHDVVKERDIDYVGDFFLGEVRSDSRGVHVTVQKA